MGRGPSLIKDDSTAEVTERFLHLGHCLSFSFFPKCRALLRFLCLCFFKASYYSRAVSLEVVIRKTKKEFPNVGLNEFSHVVMVIVPQLQAEDVI